MADNASRGLLRKVASGTAHQRLVEKVAGRLGLDPSDKEAVIEAANELLALEE